MASLIRRTPSLTTRLRLADTARRNLAELVVEEARRLVSQGEAVVTSYEDAKSLVSYVKANEDAYESLASLLRVPADDGLLALGLLWGAEDLLEPQPPPPSRNLRLLEPVLLDDAPVSALTGCLVVEEEPMPVEELLTCWNLCSEDDDFAFEAECLAELAWERALRRLGVVVAS
jgi:hypothetical protein